MDLILFTHDFPSEGGDSAFIGTEWKVLCKQFDRIVLITKSKNHSIMVDLPDNVEIFWYNPTSKDLFRHLPAAIFKASLYMELVSAMVAGKISTWKGRIKDIFRTKLEEITFKKYLHKKDILFNDCTIAYTFWMSGETLALLDAKKDNIKMKVVSRVHGYDLYNERTNGGWQPFRRRLSKELDAIFFVSDKGKAYFDENWPSSNGVRIIAKLGCEPSLSGGKSGFDNQNEMELNVLSCSNVIPLKRIELIVKALSLLPVEYRVNWSHIGDGPEIDKIMKLAHDLLDRKRNISWELTGKLSHKDVDRFYSEHKIELFITTSESEGSPVSIQEAFAHSVPVIGTAVGGIPELIEDGKNGLLLDANSSPEKVADAIKTFIEYPIEKRKEMAQNAYYLWSNEYNSEINAKKFGKELVELVD
ncbi:MAG: glycosyltransferase [Butyrivibrio sp.]